MDKVVFWDFDGTLVKPNERFVDNFAYALKENGVPIAKGEIRAFL